MPKDNVVREVGKYYTLAFLLPACILVGFGIGFGLDKLFGTGYLKIIFLLLGVAAGIIEVIRELSHDDAAK
ncbi:MAG TPA: AtpZ/AtpI family protein [Bryobacteraceae bacterium]|jgi:F0F1-type ATP synthase assembly protein I|nr:AtpZ/AtpI family protein [Bryobacteraceae bacterium]